MRYNTTVKKNCKSGGPRVSNKDRRGGFAVISVLVILLILTFLSAIIMDLALNAHSTTMEMIENKKLYNAAQSGAEWGVAMLVANRDDLDDDVKDGISGISFSPTNPVHINAIRATVNGGTYLDSTQPASSMFGTGITVEVDILDCNYEPPTNYHSLLPPVKLPDTGGGGGTPGGLSQIGSSGYLDPNRNISFGSGGGTMRYFVVRSKAQVSGGREVAVETMVVVTE
jgi:hypothetical protein